MHKILQLLHIQKHPKRLTAIFCSLALIFEALEFGFKIHHHGFSYATTLIFFFDLAAIALIIISLILKNPILAEISLIVLKVFDGTYYPVQGAKQLDKLIISGGSAFDIASHVVFATSALCLFAGLVMYCIHIGTTKRLYWDIMELLIIIATTLMVISFFMYLSEAIKKEVHWSEVLEPLALSCLFAGMYCTCEYVEKEKKDNV